MNLYNYLLERSDVEDDGCKRSEKQGNSEGGSRRSSRNCTTNTKNLKNKYYEWHRYYSLSGKPFYYSPLTHETQWEKPSTNNVIIFDTKSPSFNLREECIYPPQKINQPNNITPSATAVGVPSLFASLTTVAFGFGSLQYQNKKQNKKYSGPIAKFGYTLQQFEEIITTNVEKIFESKINTLSHYHLENGEILIGYQYKSELEIMEEGYWLMG